VSGSTLISFDKVWKSYGQGEARVHALAGVDLAIRKSEFVAIMNRGFSLSVFLIHGEQERVSKALQLRILGKNLRPSRLSVRR